MEKYSIRVDSKAVKNVIKMQNDVSALNKYDFYLEGYKQLGKSLLNLTKSISPLMRDSMLTSLAEVNKAWRNNLFEITKNCTGYGFTEGTREMAYRLSQVVKSQMPYDYMASAKAVVENLASDMKNVQIEQMKQMCQIDYSTIFDNYSKIFSNMYISSDTLEQAICVAYETVQAGFAEEELDTEFSSVKEVEEVINENIKNPKGIQEIFANWSQKKIIQYYIIWQIILFMYGNFFQPYFQEHIGVPVTTCLMSNMKELPQKGAKIICQLKENVEAIIIENTNYYYKVSFSDENGVEREGYIAKRNLKLIEEDTVLTNEAENKTDG